MEGTPVPHTRTIDLSGLVPPPDTDDLPAPYRSEDLPCVTAEDPNPFHSRRVGGALNHDRREAQAMCVADCPVRAWCLTRALADPYGYGLVGVLGGWTETRRTRFLAELAADRDGVDVSTVLTAVLAADGGHVAA